MPTNVKSGDIALNSSSEKSHNSSTKKLDLDGEFFKVISDPSNTEETLLDLAKSPRREILYLVPNDRALVRVHKIGLINLLIQASRQRNAKIRIICPLSDLNSDIVKNIMIQAPEIKIIPGKSTSSGIFIVDNLKMLRVEVKDPRSDDFSEAIGYALYSNSKASVSSFKMFFDLLWNACLQNEELVRLDKMKDEFVNIAAHEFKTPIQSILGYLELAKADSEYNNTDKKRGGLIDAAYRNAVRLHRLTKNLLEVTRIESHSLYLYKKRFDLKKLVLTLVNDFQNNASLLPGAYKGSEAIYNKFTSDFSNVSTEDVLFVIADEEMITEVLLNLLDNAAKFTKGGDISVTISKDNVKNQFLISVKDTGLGIPPEIKSRLFTKFASKSSGGTGLGLFISRSIVEAHGGKIWFEENPHTNGSTFCFGIPLPERY